MFPLNKVITLQEKFYAEVVIEARWLYDPEFASWNPNFYVKNALGDVKQEVVNELVDNLDEPVNRDHINKKLSMYGKFAKSLAHFGKNLN